MKKTWLLALGLLAGTVHAAIPAEAQSVLDALGGALGARYIISGSIGRLGETYVDPVELEKAQSASLKHSAPQAHRGPAAAAAAAQSASVGSAQARPSFQAAVHCV